MTIVEGLLYCIINVNILIKFFFIDLSESSIFINNVVYLIIFLFKSTIVIVVIFVVFKLTVFSLIIVDSRQLRVVKPVLIFVSLMIR